MSILTTDQIRALISPRPRPPGAQGLPGVRVHVWCPIRGREVPVIVHTADPLTKAEAEALAAITTADAVTLLTHMEPTEGARRGHQKPQDARQAPRAPMEVSQAPATQPGPQRATPNPRK